MNDSEDKTTAETHFHNQVKGPIHTGSGDINIEQITVQRITPFSLAAPLERISSFLNWPEADSDIRANPYALFMWSFRQLTEKFTADHFVKFCALLLIWVGANFLLIPALQWPLDDPLQRQTILTNLAVGFILLPLVIGLLTPAKDTLHFQAKTREQKLVLLSFRLTGAVVGFAAFMLVLIFLALALYYLDITLNKWVWRGFILMGPLAFSHISARVVPGNQLKLQGLPLHWRQIEGWWLVVFLAIGPGVALFLHESYDNLVRSEMGFFFLVLLLCLALWTKQQSNKPFLSRRATLIFFGVLLPVLFFVLSVLLLDEMALDWWTQPLETFYLICLVLFFVFCPFTYWIALMLGDHPLKLSVSGILFFLITLLAATALPYLPQLVALWAVVTGIVVWIPLGRYFFGLHPSIGFILLTITGSLFLWAKTAVPLSMNLLLTASLVSLFIWWTYRDGFARNNDQLSETH